MNNAGILNTDGLLRLKMEDAHRVMQVNYFAPADYTRNCEIDVALKIGIYNQCGIYCSLETDCG